MAKFPALPLWTDAWIADTHHLNFCESGMYVALLVLMWRTPRCKVPNDNAWLARHLRASGDEIEKQFRPLIKEFCCSDGNWLWQKRLLKEFLFVTKQSRLQSVRAKSRWNNKKHIYRSDAASGIAPTPTPTPTPQKNTEANASLLSSSATTSKNLEVVSEEQASGRPRAGWDEFWAQYPHKVGKRAAYAAFFRALKRAPFNEIMAGLLRYAAKTDDRPWCNPATWLNQDRWQDEPAQGGNGHDRRTIVEKGRDWIEQLRADEQRGSGPGSDAALWPIPGHPARR